MSGHNKWAQIKHKKGIEDAKRSKLFSLLAKTIAIEAKRAKGDKNDPGLRAAIERAKKENFPNENIERAIARGIGAGAAYESVLYEAYGPGGVALLIEGLTDSVNRMSQEIKHLLAAQGGSLAAPGSASWAFVKQNPPEGGWKPSTTIPLPDADADALGNLIEALEKYDDVRAVFTNAAEDEDSGN